MIFSCSSLKQAKNEDKSESCNNKLIKALDELFIGKTFKNNTKSFVDGNYISNKENSLYGMELTCRVHFRDNYVKEEVNEFPYKLSLMRDTRRRGNPLKIVNGEPAKAISCNDKSLVISSFDSETRRVNNNIILKLEIYNKGQINILGKIKHTTRPNLSFSCIGLKAYDEKD